MPELNCLAANSLQPRKSILTMQTLNQSLSISLLAWLKSMPIQYPANKKNHLQWDETKA